MGRGEGCGRRGRPRQQLATLLNVAITGGIGAGKSEALKAFAKHGAATISSDEIVHAMLRGDDTVKQALRERWGEKVFDDIGQVYRPAIAEIVFADPAELAWLEGLLHPRVELAYLRWREELAAEPKHPSICVTEVPLLYEVGAERLFDAVVVVTAPAETRWGRTAVSNDGREGRLLPDEEKIAKADFSYVNQGSLKELDRWVIGVLAELRKRTGDGSEPVAAHGAADSGCCSSH